VFRGFKIITCETSLLGCYGDDTTSSFKTPGIKSLAGGRKSNSIVFPRDIALHKSYSFLTPNMLLASKPLEFPPLGDE